MKYTLDAAMLAERKTAHTYLQEQLELPGYYGKNLDALYDCLREQRGLEITFVNTENAEGYFEKILRVFRDAQKHDETMTVTCE